MKRYIVLTCAVLFSIGLLSTVFSSCRNTVRPNDDRRDRTPRDTGNDRDRTQTRRGTDCDQSSREGGGSCKGDDDCEDYCDDLFGGRDYQECLGLTANEVEGMWNAFDDDEGILEDPDEDDLEEVHPDDIRNALEIDERIWDAFIDDYGTSEANDVLYWIATNECVYDSIEDSFDEDDMKGFMEDIMLQVDSGGLIPAALEPLGDEADDDETFLYLADQEGNSKAVELVHELLWEECVGDRSVTSARKSLYNAAPENDDKSSACLLGEFYCKQDSDGDYIFEDIFETVVDDELDNFIRGGKNSNIYTDGLGISSSDYDEIEEVCKVVCSVRASGGIRNGNSRPARCS